MLSFMNLPKLSHLIRQANICLHCEVKALNLWREPVKSNYQQAIIPLLGEYLRLNVNFKEVCLYLHFNWVTPSTSSHSFWFIALFYCHFQNDIFECGHKGKKKQLYFYFDNSNTKLWVVWIDCGCAQTQSCLTLHYPIHCSVWLLTTHGL